MATLLLSELGALARAITVKVYVPLVVFRRFPHPLTSNAAPRNSVKGTLFLKRPRARAPKAKTRRVGSIQGFASCNPSGPPLKGFARNASDDGIVKMASTV